MNRAEWGRVDKVIYTSERFLPRRSTSLFGRFLPSSSPTTKDGTKSTTEEEQGGRDEGWKETAQGSAPFFFWPSYCGSLLHAGCPRPAKGLSQLWNEANARCRLRSPPRERNTLSGEVERQKVTDDRLLVNPVMALPLTIIIG